MKIIEYKDGKTEPKRTDFFQDLKYWSNACGDLHHHGEYDIIESELPAELKRAYNELWTEGSGSLCYLVEYKEKYGIALVNEFDNTYGNDIDSSMEAYKCIVEQVNELSKMKEFEKAVFLVGENTGIDECHELIVILPCDTDKGGFENIANILDRRIYYR